MPRKKKTLLTAANAKGMTLRVLAQKVGLHHTYLSHLSAGRRVPTIRRAAKLAKPLGLTLDEFFKILPRAK